MMRLAVAAGSWITALVLAACAGGGPVASNAMTALRGGDARKAEEILRRDAAAGNVNSMKLLGAMLESGIGGDEGRGVPANPREALDWYRKAFDATGDVDAGKRLGVLYATGRGTLADPDKAIEIFRRVGVDVDDITGTARKRNDSKLVQAWMVAFYVDIATRVQQYPREALRRGDSGSVVMHTDTATRTVDVVGGTATDNLKSVVRGLASRALILVPPPEEAARAHLKTEIVIVYQLGG